MTRYEVEYRFKGEPWKSAESWLAPRRWATREEAEHLAVLMQSTASKLMSLPPIEYRVVEVTRAVVFELGPGVDRGGGAETPEAEAGREAPGAGAEEAGR